MSAVTPVAPTQEFLGAARDQFIEFEPGELETLGRYLGLLLDANTRMNLTRITEPGEMWMRHVLDSLTLLPFLAEISPRRVIDVGSGGGAPGIPLAVTVPTTKFTLLEATEKKANFLEHAVRELGLSNVRVINDRAESAAAKGSPGRESFDVAIARALGPMPVLLELTIPFLKVGGVLFAIKGAKAEAEVESAKRAIQVLKGNLIGIHSTPTGRVVMVEKIAPSPGRFPRLPGEPKRTPIG